MDGSSVGVPPTAHSPSRSTRYDADRGDRTVPTRNGQDDQNRQFARRARWGLAGQDRVVPQRALSEQMLSIRVMSPLSTWSRLAAQTESPPRTSPGPALSIAVVWISYMATA